MFAVINEPCFAGEAYARYLKEARRGILRPEPEKLKVGRAYYRIGHSHDRAGLPISDDRNLASGWWLEYDAYRGILDFAQVAGVSATVVARVRCAVAPAFGQSNRVYRAELNAGLRVFIGAGRPIESEGHIFFPPGDIKQIFIPGMANADGTRSGISRLAFPKYTCSEVSEPVMLIHGE